MNAELSHHEEAIASELVDWSWVEENIAGDFLAAYSKTHVIRAVDGGYEIFRGRGSKQQPAFCQADTLDGAVEVVEHDLKEQS